jgi:hypothetical protein
VQGNINANIAKGYYTRKQYDLAHLEALRHLKDYASDYWKFGNKSQIGQELDFFQVVHGVHYNMYGEKTAITKLKAAPNLITSPKEMSEFELQVAQYLAMSKANPVKVKDQWVEFRKAFEIKDGKLQPVEGAEITDKDIDDFVFRVSYLNRAINGAYRADERNALQKSVLGDLAFYLNGYLISGITHRFAGTRYSKEADMIYKGYHTQMAQYIGDLFKYRQNIGKKWATMTSEEKARVHRSLNEIPR